MEKKNNNIERKKENMLTAVMILLSIHLIYCNTDLLIRNEEPGCPGWKMILLGIVAIGYSVLSAITTINIKKFWIVFVFAILDMCGVLIQKYHDTDWIPMYIAAYTFWTIVMIWMMLNRDESEQKTDSQTTTIAEDTPPKCEQLPTHEEQQPKVEKVETPKLVLPTKQPQQMELPLITNDDVSLNRLIRRFNATSKLETATHIWVGLDADMQAQLLAHPTLKLAEKYGFQIAETHE